MNMPTIGGLNLTINQFKQKSQDTSAIEGVVSSYTDTFEWSDSTTVQEARKDISKLAEEHHNKAGAFGMGGITSVVGGSAIAGIAGSAGLGLGVALVGVAFVAGGVVAASMGVGKFLDYLGVGDDSRMVREWSEKGMDPELEPTANSDTNFESLDEMNSQRATDRDLEQKRTIARTVRDGIRHTLDKSHEDLNSAPNILAVSMQDANTDFLSLGPPERFDAVLKSKDHQVDSFEAHFYPNRRQEERHLTMETTEQGKVYGIQTERGTNSVLHKADGSFEWVSRP